MAYPKAQVKPDDPSINKFFYVCQKPGCGAIINPALPVAEKNPSPKWCADCQNKATREKGAHTRSLRHMIDVALKCASVLEHTRYWENSAPDVEEVLNSLI